MIKLIKDYYDHSSYVFTSFKLTVIKYLNRTFCLTRVFLDC